MSVSMSTMLDEQIFQHFQAGLPARHYTLILGQGWIKR